MTKIYCVFKFIIKNSRNSLTLLIKSCKIVTISIRGSVMIAKQDIEQVREGLKAHVGKKIRITSRKGRKKSIIRNGTIEQLYPCVFTVRLDNFAEDTSEERCVSYSYTDILTKNVEIAIYRNQDIE